MGGTILCQCFRESNKIQLIIVKLNLTWKCAYWSIPAIYFNYVCQISVTKWSKEDQYNYVIHNEAEGYKNHCKICSSNHASHT